MIADQTTNRGVARENNCDSSVPGKSAPALPFALADLDLAPESSVPIYEQICRAIRKAIDVGDLAAGAPMPTTRELATALGLGKNTITAAYSRLVAESYLVSVRRRGTEVSRVRFGAVAPASESQEHNAPSAIEDESIEIGYGAQRALTLGRPTSADSRPFALSSPDPSLYPRNQLSRRLSAEFCRMPAVDVRSGWTRFQTAVSNYLRHMRGVQCEAAQVIPTTSLESAVDLTARVLLDPGHCVLMEEPAQCETWQIFKAAGANLFPLTADRAGADPARAKCPPPRLIFVSPSVSFPFGVRMPEERRISVLQFARRTGALIFECDVGWELSWSKRTRAIQGYDGERQVVYFGSLHETIGPPLRVAYLIVPAAFAFPFAEIAKRVGYGPDGFVLSALASFIEENDYAVHVKTVRATYARRMGMTIDACRRHIKNAEAMEPSGGFHLTLKFSDNFDEQHVAQMAERYGLVVTPLSLFYHQSPGNRGLVLGLGAIPDRNIENSICRLSEIIEEAGASHRSYDLAS